MHLKVIACEVLARETYHCAARSRNTADVELLTQGLHDNPDIGRARLQALIDAASPETYSAVVLGYGLCSNMAVGLRAGSVPLVIPRAHDCITLLLGSKERYAAEFSAHPGTYWYSPGWLEYPERGGERVELVQKSGLGPTLAYDQLVEKYGEDNARYLAETMSTWAEHYTRGALIAFDFVADHRYEERTKEICREQGWEFVRLEGSLALLQRMLDGDWPDDQFVVLQPGQSLEASHDEYVLRRAL